MVRFAAPDRRPNPGPSHALKKLGPGDKAIKSRPDEKPSLEVRDRVLMRLKRMQDAGPACQNPGLKGATARKPPASDQKGPDLPDETRNAYLGRELPQKQGQKQHVQHVRVMCRPPLLAGSPAGSEVSARSTVSAALARKIVGIEPGGWDRPTTAPPSESTDVVMPHRSPPQFKTTQHAPPPPSALRPAPALEGLQEQGRGSAANSLAECRRLQEELQSCYGQLDALKEEVEAHKELDGAREAAMERLTRHAAGQESEAAEAQALNAQLKSELEQAAQWVDKGRLVAQHASSLAGAVRATLAECGFASGAAAAAEELGADELMLLDKRALDSELRALTGGLERCVAALHGGHEKQREAAEEAAVLRERIGGLAAAKEAAEAREQQLQDAAMALEEQLGHLRNMTAEHETALRRETEESVLESKVAKMMDSHSLALERFQEAMQVAEAAHSKQAVAEQDLREARLQLQEEREARAAAVLQLRGALGKERDETARLRKEKDGCLGHVRELQSTIEQLDAELLQAQDASGHQHGMFAERIQALETELGQKEQAIQQRLEAEQQRAAEAREALVELMSEVESMSCSLEAEKARAASLGAALSTTREMVKSLKGQAAEQGEALQSATHNAHEQERAREEISALLKAVKQQALMQEERAARELDAARLVVDKLTGRIAFLERQLAQHKEEPQKISASIDDLTRKPTEEALYQDGMGPNGLIDPCLPDRAPGSRDGAAWQHRKAAVRSTSQTQHDLSAQRKRLFSFDGSLQGWGHLKNGRVIQSVTQEVSPQTTDSDAASVKHWVPTPIPTPSADSDSDKTMHVNLYHGADKEEPPGTVGWALGTGFHSTLPLEAVKTMPQLPVSLQNQEISDLVQEVKRMHSRLAIKNHQAG